jgi:hypothetical protein
VYAQFFLLNIMWWEFQLAIEQSLPLYFGGRSR